MTYIYQDDPKMSYMNKRSINDKKVENLILLSIINDVLSISFY